MLLIWIVNDLRKDLFEINKEVNLVISQINEDNRKIVLDFEGNDSSDPVDSSKEIPSDEQNVVIEEEKTEPLTDDSSVDNDKNID